MRDQKNESKLSFVDFGLNGGFVMCGWGNDCSVVTLVPHHTVAVLDEQPLPEKIP
jgi:hypothetical protein